MSLALSWFLVVPALFTLLAWGAATLVYSTAPRREVNRVLALVLFFEGSSLGVGIGLQSAFPAGSPDEYAAAVVTGIGFFGTTLLYPAFLGLALDTPLVRPFRAPAGRFVLYVATPAMIALLIFDGLEAIPYTPVLLAATVTLFGLAATFHAWRRAPRGTIARRRAGAFFLAFGTRDSGMLLYILIYTFVAFGLGLEPDNNVLYYVLASFVALSYILLAYGLVRSELLDADVKLRWTIRQSTVAGIFVAVFVVVAQVAQLYFERYGVLLGGVAAALLVFAIGPLQRVAARVAEQAVPNAKPTREWSEEDRRALFRDQLQAAWADGSLTKEERAMLERLRERLGIAPDEATRIEREVVAE